MTLDLIPKVEPAYRGKSLGYSALCILLAYATSNPPQGLGVPPSVLTARIGLANTPSIRLFERLGFVQSKVVEVFQEVEMKYAGEKGWETPWTIRDYE